LGRRRIPDLTDAQTKTTLIGWELLPEKARVYHSATSDSVFNRSTSFPGQNVAFTGNTRLLWASAIFADLNTWAYYYH
jgi:hypothetical protein